MLLSVMGVVVSRPGESWFFVLLMLVGVWGSRLVRHSSEPGLRVVIASCRPLLDLFVAGAGFVAYRSPTFPFGLVLLILVGVLVYTALDLIVAAARRDTATDDVDA